ncbi:MAG: hypothetical protein EXR05_07185 [Acetobacteraceae bacterium]|nr:hypothetical protein [Acetobacteraceae bacterium]
MIAWLNRADAGPSAQGLLISDPVDFRSLAAGGPILAAPAGYIDRVDIVSDPYSVAVDAVLKE